MLIRSSYIFVIVILILFGVFGYLAMSFMNHGMGHQCPFDAITGKDCAYLKDLFGADIHHITVLKQLLRFFTVNPTLFDVWALAIWTAVLFFGGSSFVLAGNFNKQQKFLEKEIIFISTEKFTRWIALLNKGGDSTLFSGA